MAAKLRITQTKSTISHIARNRATVKALGLHGIGSTSTIADNDATRGMVRQVRFLVTVEEIADGASEKPAKSTKRHADDRAAVTNRSEDDAPASPPSEDSKEKTTE